MNSDLWLVEVTLDTGNGYVHSKSGFEYEESHGSIRPGFSKWIIREKSTVGSPRGGLLAIDDSVVWVEREDGVCIVSTRMMTISFAKLPSKRAKQDA